MLITKEKITYSRTGLVALHVLTLLFVMALLIVTAYAVPETSPEIASEETSYEEVSQDIEGTSTYYCIADEALNVRTGPGTEFDILGTISRGDEIQVDIKSNPAEEEWGRILYDDAVAYVHSSYISENEDDVPDPESYTWDGPKLTRRAGTIQGPSGKETYYNLKMSGVVKIMRKKGFSESEYPYWVRDDGVKMLGDYVMVAANLDVHPRGTLVPCSLGMALVCDTGSFAKHNSHQLDIAVNW